jgi:preprotein translocase subunit YajC
MLMRPVSSASGSELLTGAKEPEIYTGGNKFKMTTNTASSLTVFLPLILFFVIMWFFLIRPQRKKDQENKEMRNNLGPGDEIVTIGGIVGTVLNVKEDSVVVYCGSDKIKMEFKKLLTTKKRLIMKLI